MNLFNLYEPKEPKTLVPLVSSKKYTVLLSILKRIWIVPHDYIKEAWSFEASKDPTDHPTARTWSCGSLNRKLRWAVPILHPWELRGNEWELCSASVIVWFIKEWQKTWRDIFKWKPNLPHRGYNTSLCIQRQKETQQCRTPAHLKWLPRYPDPVNKS